MGRLNISSSTLTSQNQGGGNSKAGLPSTIGLRAFSWRIIRRRTNYCCLTGEIDTTGGNDDDITYTGFTDGSVYTLAAGSIMVGGSFTKFNNETISRGLIKLNDDGSPDTAFNNNLGTGFGGGDAYGVSVRSIIEDQSGNYIIGGGFNKFQAQSANNIIKLDSSGNIDIDFSNNVFGGGENGFTLNGSVAAASVLSIIEDQSGNYIIGGTFDKFQDQSANNIIKLDSSGNIDIDFSNNVFGGGENGFTLNGSVAAASVLSIIEDQSGNYIIGGTFDKFQDQSANNIIKLDSSGNRVAYPDWKII